MSFKRIFTFIILLFLPLKGLSATDFTLTITFKNNSNNWKKLNLEKGRILEIAEVDSSRYQSIFITSGDGIVIIPPNRTVKRTIKGICLHKGLKFPPEGCTMSFSPFIVTPELITTDQKKIHSFTDEPADNVKIIIAKGYSDEKKNGRMADRDEAIRNAIENAAIQGGIRFESEKILKNIDLIKDFRRLTVKEKSVGLKGVIHEEYKERSGEYLFIGEFEVISKSPKPELFDNR